MYRNDVHISELILTGLRKSLTSDGTVTWQIEDLEKVFSQVCLSAPGQITVFLDGLDEMEIQPGTSHLDFILFFLRTMKPAQPDSPSSPRLCFSSRPIPSVENWWKGHPHPQLCMQDENRNDISRYVQSEMDELRQRYELQLDLDSIGQGIIDKANGVFLWVVLVMRQVLSDVQCATQYELQQSLEVILLELIELYRYMMSKIDERIKPKALQMIQLVLFAYRPLILAEFRMAISAMHVPRPDSLTAMISDTDIIQTDSAMSRRIHAFTGGLLEVGPVLYTDIEMDIEYRFVQVIHQSVLDFFLEHDGLLILEDDGHGDFKREAHKQLLEACLNMISMAANSDDTVIGMPREELPFWNYTGDKWYFHAAECTVEI